MPRNNTATLQSTDWNEEWKHLQRVRRKSDDSQYWNKRSKNYSTKDSPNPYVADFLELAGIREGESVMDMGCGTGSLAVPLALAGHRVVAADFSQGMLDEMAQRARAASAVGIEAHHMSWDDDWSACGIEPESVDVAFASRSISTSDMLAALMKLERVSRRRMCITISTGCSPRMDPAILAACGMKNTQGKDFQYAFNILVNAGVDPTVNYIKSSRKDTFDTLDEAFVDFARMIEESESADNPDAVALGKRNLQAWLGKNLVENEDAGKLDKKGIAEKKLRLLHPRIITWAFIAWDK